ncbi:MAG: type II toxin-antitoxin system HigB family toxin [Alistipes sp.]|nr:type II toxin-antitoxin system HigB family toxin [Candidatus Alistipes equi]
MPKNLHYVFNIHGNHHRLVVIVKFFNHTLLVRWIDTHVEYDKIIGVTGL